MPMTHALTPAQAHARPEIRTLDRNDLRAALRAGFDDFLAMPTHVMFVIALYPIAGLVIAALVFQNNLLPLLFPLLAGFALVGPFAAIGLYELSRRREKGMETSFRHAYESLSTGSAGSLVVVGLALTVLFFAWLVSAMGLYWALYGNAQPASLTAMLADILTTPRGWALIVLGNMIGFAFSLVALSISVFSIPMLVDRDVDWRVAVDTSMEAVRANPATMVSWGILVAGLLALGMLPLFVGLALVLPVLGHATWHLYRRAIAR